VLAAHKCYEIPASGPRALSGFQVRVPRKRVVTAHGVRLPVSTGLESIVAFQSTGPDQVAFTADFVLLDAEVNDAIRDLSAGSTEITALHNHMLDESPRLFFLHCRAQGKPLEIARTAKTVLDKTSR